MNRFLKSFKYAFAGIRRCILEERNMRIHTTAAFYTVVLASFYHFSRAEWGILILTITLVMALECLNTALERLCDRVGKEYNPLLMAAKDAAAGAVLLSAIGAVIIGGILFWRPSVFAEIVKWFSSRPLAIFVLILSACLLFMYCAFGFSGFDRGKRNS